MNSIQERYNLLRSFIIRFIYNIHPNISIGKNTIIEKGVKLRLQYGGSIKIGQNCILYSYATLITHGGEIVIGDNSSVNPYAVIYGQSFTKIGNGVRIATQVAIIPSNHIYKDATQPIYTQGLSMKGIKIEDDVWLGAGVKVLDGVTIGEGCVVGANSVVSKSLKPYGIYVGVPARLIKNRK